MTMKKLSARIFVGLLLIVGSGLLYMNVRAIDPIQPGWQTYDKATFDTLMAADKPVLVEIYASWCPTCVRQQMAFKSLAESGKAPTLPAVRVDFDHDKDFGRHYGFEGTGILAIFRGGHEVARAGGLVTPDAILAFLKDNGVS
ncbi:thioredoxin family protein [Kordiimonas marina]|uniref:thioredoxin family protein n=1 Tax=Kordiimonas marina TaxID=2872312 RepID=UPI001FF64CDD|nr:thioredoxin family protein [Kordiimonas marina]MCJ9429174.1 thioredoxin family protein [Kordiimonas marina]